MAAGRGDGTERLIQACKDVEVSKTDARTDVKLAINDKMASKVSGAVESEIDNDVLQSNGSVHPNFGFNVARNVTTAVGHTAFLHCRVEQLGDKAKLSDHQNINYISRAIHENKAEENSITIQNFKDWKSIKEIQ
ncbi:unnamed protein product [Phaedon cochleariae]|uniref:Uncharacterized protein n=1 Tax=Phaedon cochleariae TaxID=80249 RepID=A0A9N9SIL7_PHACE|nr:unnamed protein product [Phaedon cochleariae]